MENDFLAMKKFNNARHLKKDPVGIVDKGLVVRWETLYTREQINEQIDDLLVWLRQSIERRFLSNAAAAPTASATAQKSKRVLRAHAQRSTRAFIYYDII